MFYKPQAYRETKLAVSVVVLTYNCEKTLKECLDSLLNQDYKDFELIVIDDFSKDKTFKILNSYRDKRIRIYRNNENKGTAINRNFGIEKSKGDLIFFTDSDCIPMKNWLKEGVEAITKKKADIVTGWTLYRNNYPSFKDRVVQGYGTFMTANLGFKRKMLKSVGEFNEELNSACGEDFDVCYKILNKGGKSVFCKDMLVIHQKSEKSYLGELKRYANYYKSKLLLKNEHNDSSRFFGRIFMPLHLASIPFPFILFIVHSFKSWKDVSLLPFTWLGYIYGRISFWAECIRKGKFYV